MITGTHWGSAIRLPALFAFVTGIPLIVLGWLGWQLIGQDRALEEQRLHKRLENAAAVLAQEVERGFVAWEDLLPTATAEDAGRTAALPSGTTLMHFDARGKLVRQQGLPAAYYPAMAPVENEPAVITDAEAREFSSSDPAESEARYRALAAAPDRRVRAAALMRLARCLRKQQRIEEALKVYADLAAMREVLVGVDPAELVARRERVALLRMSGAMDAAAQETALLTSSLREGRFLLDKTTFDFYSRVATEADTSAEDRDAPLRLAEALEHFWPVWQRQAGGRAGWTMDGNVVASVWRRTESGTTVVVGDIGSVLTPIRDLAARLDAALTLEEGDGTAVWGMSTDGVAASVTPPNLPWTVRVRAASPAPEAFAPRQNLWIAGFALAAIAIAAASYALFRSVNRELAVARLQSDFVAAVSHEFRTPLTAMRHITEILEEGKGPTEDYPEYFGALGKETRRLHEMVENLLDFGRMESGRRAFHFEGVDVAELAEQVVDEFRSRTVRPARLELERSPDPPLDAQHVRADAESLTLALRNLVDNALKYSPDSSVVTVRVERRDGWGGVSIEDHGAGISNAEKRGVFRKFVRGQSAREMNVKGTGLGLAMVDRIVKAHGGRLELASEPGRGSRFTILLPLEY